MIVPRIKLGLWRLQHIFDMQKSRKYCSVGCSLPLFLLLWSTKNHKVYWWHTPFLSNATPISLKFYTSSLASPMSQLTYPNPIFCYVKQCEASIKHSIWYSTWWFKHLGTTFFYWGSLTGRAQNNLVEKTLTRSRCLIISNDNSTMIYCIVWITRSFFKNYAAINSTSLTSSTVYLLDTCHICHLFVDFPFHIFLKCTYADSFSKRLVISSHSSLLWTKETGSPPIPPFCTAQHHCHLLLIPMDRLKWC